MQIHELNRKPKVVSEQSVNEVDLVGPTGIFAVGKQVGKQLLSKNFKALYNSPALASAQQAAAQQSAAASAQKLTNPGAFRRAMGNQAYQVGGGVKPPVTTAQQLQAVNANPAVQQLVKNLSSQWASQSSTLKQKQQPITSTTESAAQVDPREVVGDPKFAGMLQLLKRQGVDLAKEAEVEKQLNSWKVEFSSWANARLTTRGVSVDNIRDDKATADMLDAASSKVAIAAQSGDTNLEKAAAEEYFNIAIAGIQAYIQNTKNAAGSQRATAAGGATANPASTDNDILTQLQNAGIPVTKVSLEKLGQLMAASSGSNTVRDTGNEVLNAMARLAGMRVTR